MAAQTARALPIDHVGVLGHSIDVLKSDWERLGFHVVGPEELLGVTETGQKRGMGQFSAHIMFAEDYIELTAVERPTPGHHLKDFLDDTGGLRLLILATEDIEAAREACLSAGLVPGAVQRAAREIGYGRGGTARFRWFQLPAEAYPDALVAYVQHDTRDVVFQPEVCRHPNTARGITRVLLAADSIPASYGRLGAGARRTRLEARTAADLVGLFGEEIAGCAPLAGLGLEVADMTRAAEVLSRGGVLFRETSEGIAVVPSAAGGVGLLLQPA